MNTNATDGFDPFEDPADRMLSELALSVQLPPSLHTKACKRFGAVCRFLDSPGSKFHGQIDHFYPQGSMAIDATISSRGTDDEYDIDIVAQLGENFRHKEPFEMLNELEDALKDYDVKKVLRQTRCVTLYYGDGMHLDVTPGLRDRFTPERQGVIAHAKERVMRADDEFIPMNAYGFIQWYNDRTPEERNVYEAFHKRWQDSELLVAADAEIDDVPEQTHFGVKNTATLALQILKRHRNIMYADSDERMPPSVMLSYYAGLAALPGTRLTDMVIRMARWIANDIRAASLQNEKLHVENPKYLEDVFTDRWPENIGQQNRYASHLLSLIDGLEKMQRKQFVSAIDLQTWLRQMFGERVITRAIDAAAKRSGQAIVSATASYSPTGKILLPITAAASAVASAVPAAAHSFFGGDCDPGTID